MPPIPINRIERFIDKVEATLAPHRVLVVGKDKAECRELLVQMRARGEADDDSEIVFVCTEFSGEGRVPMPISRIENYFAIDVVQLKLLIAITNKKVAPAGLGPRRGTLARLVVGWLRPTLAAYTCWLTGTLHGCELVRLRLSIV
jgi:hypothetical protein